LPESALAHCARKADVTTRAGESDQRIYLLDAWQESPVDSERERAALLWTDTLPRVSETHPSDDVWEQVKPHFAEMELVDLTTAIGVINVWNRLNVGFRTQPPIARKQAA